MLIYYQSCFLNLRASKTLWKVMILCVAENVNITFVIEKSQKLAPNFTNHISSIQAYSLVTLTK